MSLPYMKFYVNDYLGSTRRFTTLQHGAYLMLLVEMWQEGPWIDSDEDYLIEVTGLTKRQFKSCWPKIFKKLVSENGKVSHPRLVKDYQEAEAKRIQNAANGKKGGSKKPKKTQENQDADEANAKQTVSDGEAKLALTPTPDSSEDAKASSESPHPEIFTDLPLVSDVDRAFDAYLETAQHVNRTFHNGHVKWVIHKKPTAKWRGLLRARLNEEGLAGWEHMLAKATKSQFLTLRINKKITVDWLAGESIFQNIVSGKYDDETRASNVTSIDQGRRRTGVDDFLEGIGAAFDAGESQAVEGRVGEELWHDSPHPNSPDGDGYSGAIEAEYDVITRPI